MNLGGSKVTKKKEISKGKYAGKVGRQDWETFIIFIRFFARDKGKNPIPNSRNSPFLRAFLKQKLFWEFSILFIRGTRVY